MSEIVMIPKNVLSHVDVLNSCVKKLENHIESLEKIKDCISLGASTGAIKSRISVSIVNLRSQNNSLKTMIKMIQMIVSEYIKAEERLADDVLLKFALLQLLKIQHQLPRDMFAFVKDFNFLLLNAGIEYKFGGDTDWSDWIMKYVPGNVSDTTILNIMSLMSIKGLSSDTVEKHKENNETAWMDYQKEHDNGKYIEDQSAMTGIQYGDYTGNRNTCGVIAVYNALQSLTDGNSPDDFPDLLAEFERNGITANGAYGTSPEATDSYFEKNGYDTKMLTGNGVSSSNVSNLSEDYDTYIMTAYNDKSDLGSMVHFVNITVEDGMYVIHNANDKESYSTLEDAVSGYNDGKGEPICLIGIRD